MLNRRQDVFGSFQRHDLKYVVIGGIASILHGVPRATFEPDILIEATPDNAQRLLELPGPDELGSPGPQRFSVWAESPQYTYNVP